MQINCGELQKLREGIQMVHGIAGWVLPRTGKAIASQARVRVALLSDACAAYFGAIGGTMPAGRIFSTFLFAFGVVVLSLAGPARAADSDGAGAANWKEVKRELRELREERKRDHQVIQTLENKVQQLETKDSRVQATTQQLQNTDQKLKETTLELQQTNAQVKTLQTKVDAPIPASQFAGDFGRYLGSHTFTVTGSAGFDFAYDQQSGALDGLHHATQNTFFFNFEPMFLYRPTDWIQFVGEFEGSFGQAGTGVDLAQANFQIFLNDYVTVEAGLFDQPFGDWYETQSPMWVNRFVTAPLPFGVEPVVPPAELGIQLRGGMQFGKLGQDFDYTVWGGNGPNFSSDVLGAAAGGPTAIASSQTNGKSIGARFRIYPLPVDAEMGRLELGASTYNGKWSQGNWFNSWGVDFNYFVGNLQTRGEWMESYRQMPNGLATDHRQGWYLQAGYFLTGLNVPFLPDKLNDYLHRLEPLVRYSGVNQRGVSTDDIAGATGIGLGGTQVGLVPDFGLSGSPALFAPHAREVALALDYWITPSIVWQNEFDIELPRAGGLFVSPSGAETPAGSIPNDHAFLSQFTIGF
jgi:TolA-binding protein